MCCMIQHPKSRPPITATCCELKLEQGCLRRHDWFAVGPLQPQECARSARAWQSRSCPSGPQVQMRLRVLSNHSSHASIACPSPAEREAKRLAIEERVRASAGFVPESPPVYLQPGGCSDDLLRARASRFSSECAHFLEEIWLPWRRHATAKQQVAPSACLSYPTERSGLGNWLPVVLDAAIAAAKAGARLQIKHHGNPGFFSVMGVRLDDAVAPCETSIPLPRMSWAYLPVNGVTQPTDVGLRSGWTPSTAPMLGCAFSLFTCPTASLTSAIHQLRTSLPIAHVAVHARFGHHSADQEGGFTRALNHAWERAQHDVRYAEAERAHRLDPRHDRVHGCCTALGESVTQLSRRGRCNA